MLNLKRKNMAGTDRLINRVIQPLKVHSTGDDELQREMLKTLNQRALVGNNKTRRFNVNRKTATI